MDDKEIREKIAALQAELERKSYQKRQNGVALQVPPAPAPLPTIPAKAPCPVCRAMRVERGPCPGCSFEPSRAAAKVERPEEPAILDTMRGFFTRGLALVRKQGFERFLGERLFAYVGMVLVVLGGAFFLKYAAQHSGPWGRVAVGALAGLGAAGAGEYFRRRPRMKGLSIPVTAGGWALLLYTAYAAHAVPASQVVTNPRLGLLILGAAAGGMLTHALAARSRLLTAFAFAVSYFAFAATDFGPQTLGVCTVLALAGAWLIRAQRMPELVPIGLVGYAVNYWPTLERSFGVHGADPWQSAIAVGAAAGVYGATALAVRTEDLDGRERSWVDAALSCGGVLFAIAANVQSGSLFGGVGAAHGLLAALVLACLSARRADPEGGSSSIQGLAAVGLAALSCWRLDSLEGQLWAFTFTAASLGLAGIALRRDSFERYGLGLAGLAGLTWLLDSPSTAAAAPFAALAVAGYFLADAGSKGHKGAGVVQRAWVYLGLGAAIIAGCTSGFDPRMRLPAAALASLALLVVGRRRGPLAPDLRVQSYGLAAAAPALGALTFLWPGEGAPALSVADAAVYGASSLVLLTPLALGRWASGPEEAVEERAAGHVFAALSVVMTTLFVAREASGPVITLWWTALGGGYLLAGLLAEKRELRWPALALLGLCVTKAFLYDLTGLALPYRMLSMSALGLLLVLCSLAYVRWGKEEPSVLSLPEGA